MTESSCERAKTHKIRVPLTRNPVKDFGSTYLAPKIWPKEKNRLMSHRGSVMPQTQNLLGLKSFNRKTSLTHIRDKSETATHTRITRDPKVPLIFTDKPSIRTLSTRKESVNESKNGEKLSGRIVNDFGKFFKNKATASTMQKSQSARNFLISKVPGGLVQAVKYNSSNIQSVPKNHYQPPTPQVC